MPNLSQQTDLRGVARLLADPDTYATTLLVWLIECYGTEAFTWHPSVIRMELEQDFQVQLPQISLDKIMAAITVVTTDLFFKDEQSFVQIANVLSSDELDDVFDPADSFECAWAITEALLLNPPDQAEADNLFAENIRRYIGFVLREEGFIRPPDVLRIAVEADFADQVKYDYADDPMFFNGIYDFQSSKTAEVETMLRGNIQELLAQVQALPLQNGSFEELAKRTADLMRE